MHTNQQTVAWQVSRRHAVTLFGGRLLGCMLIFCAACPSAISGEPERLDRYQLLQYHRADGSIEWATTREQWQCRRAEIVRGIQAVMGTLPVDKRRGALNVQVDEQVDAGSYVRQLISYESEPGCRTPAYLCIPKQVEAGGGKAPAVLCLHPTDNTVGHKVVVGLGGLPRRNYAAELAQRGYVTLAPAYPHLANYWPNLERLGYASGTMKAIWDNSRGLDLLSVLPVVDASRGFGAIGHSLGGHNAIFTAVFDPRITVVVSSCGFDSFLDYYGGDESRWLFGAGWCQMRYMPRLSNYRGKLDQIPFDFPELLGALAPRPLFVNAPLRDSNFQTASVDRCVAAALPVYQLYGQAERLVVKHPDCEHDFPDAVRQQAYAFIDAALRGCSK